jgi:hypothetical protein
MEESMKRASFAYAATAFVLAVSSPSYGQQAKTHLGGKASGLVTLFANVPIGTTQDLELQAPDGTTGPFTLPANTVLVVTDLIAAINGLPTPGQTRGGLINQAGTGVTSPYFSFDSSQQPSQGIHLTGGARWNQVPRASNAGDSKTAVFLFVYGYLAKNK